MTPADQDRTRVEAGLVVGGVDDSPGGRAALHDATRRGAQLDVPAAFRPPERDRGSDPPASTAGGAADRGVAEVHGTVRDRTRGILEEVLTDVGDAVDAPAVTVLAVRGSAGEALVHASRTADLLVVGSRGRGATASAVLGSVTVVHPVGDRAPATVAG